MTLILNPARDEVQAAIIKAALPSAGYTVHAVVIPPYWDIIFGEIDNA